MLRKTRTSHSPTVGGAFWGKLNNIRMNAENKIKIIRIKTINKLKKEIAISENFGYFIFCISGKGLIYIDNYEIQINSNSIINIIANSIIEIESSKQNIDIILIKYNKEIKEILSIHSLRLFCPVTGALLIKPNPSMFSDMLFYINKIEKQIIDTENMNKDLIILNLIIIAKELSNEISLKNTNRRIENKTILKFINLVDANFKNNKNLDFYSEQIFISNKSLYRAFKDNLGISPKEFINFKLSMEAKKMMLHSDLSIKEISSQLGFQSQYNFTNFFKNNNNNTSPSNYKLLMSKNHIILS